MRRERSRRAAIRQWCRSVRYCRKASSTRRLLHANEADEAILRRLIERHLRFTGSTLALSMLDHWDATRAKFVKVFPIEYLRALSEMYVKAQCTQPPAIPGERAAA